jgi:carboxymethylenebutenolidase
MAFRPYLIEEITRDCAAGALTRREAIRRLGLLGVSGAVATGLLAAVSDVARASSDSTLPPTETASDSAADSTTPLAEGDEVVFPGPEGDLFGVFSAAADPPNGAVLVIHENRGLTPHIRTIPPRLAADGYSALAIDLLSHEGGTATMSEGDAQAALGNAPAERLVADMRAGLDELERRYPDSELAVIGFCFGGGMTWTLLAAGDPRIRAAVPFYGPLPEDADFSGSPNAAVLGIYAELDDFVNPTMAAAAEALEAAGLEHELLTFEGVDHAFFNDTGRNYDADAAGEAYVAMLEWFDQHLTAAPPAATTEPAS